ncbi:MAG: DUF4277 domain-containing protein [Planctomycetes bacterium]|nr:DUF4277 domain-containing protein [Planctomycetota bacterium]MCW8141327.1 hypothetical protein [Planctomycetota bacterium]
MDGTQQSSGRLDELLLIANELRRLGVASLVDERVPADPRSRVTHPRPVRRGPDRVDPPWDDTLYSISETLEP